MDKIFEDNGTVFIKTYCFESGLWYLAKSLGDLLESQGHEVYYVPKSKYELMSASFRRTYPSPHNPSDFEGVKILNLNNKDTINSQLLKHIVKHDAKYLISFETLMRKGNWITLLKRRFRNKLKVIDVPMAEWIDERYLEARSYKMFDEVWALNPMTAGLFKEHKYSHIREISWDVVDYSLFNKESRPENKKKINFLHLASTNPDYSTKNTEKVIKTFDQFVRKEKPTVDCQLKIQGQIPKSCELLVEKHGNITSNSGIISRQALAELYKNSDCIIAPSSREGLSLALYEGQASGCKIVTTDAEPMNYIKTPYLCEVRNKRRDRSLIPLAMINEKSLYDNFKRVYEDIKNGK